MIPQTSFSEKIQRELDEEKSWDVIFYQKQNPRTMKAIVSDLSFLVRNSRNYSEEALADRLVRFVRELERKQGVNQK